MSKDSGGVFMDAMEWGMGWLEGAGGIFLLLVVHFLIKRSIRKNQERFLDRKHKTLALLLSVLQAPITLLLWVLGVAFIIDLLCRRLGFIIGLGYVHSLRSAAVVAIAAWLLLRWKRKCQDFFLVESLKKVDVTTVSVVGRLTTIAILILTSLTILQIFGMNIAPLIAFGSVGAASLGFAGKDVIANFCSGLILHVSRPFVMGDEIDLPERGLSGVVEEIGWFRVTIRDSDKRAVYLPNNYFSTMVLVNVSRMTHRRMKQTIQLPFEACHKIPDLVEAIRKEVSVHGGVDALMPMDIHLHHFGEYALQLEVEVFFKETNKQLFHTFQQEVLISIQKLASERGVEIATPIEQVIQRFS